MIEELKKREIDELAILAADDENALEKLIMQERAYIRACAGKTLFRHISKDSEEELLAIEAFVEAVGAYSFAKGSFLSFAKLVINRRLIDEVRKEKTVAHIIPMDPTNIAIEQDKNSGMYLRDSFDTETGITKEIEELSKTLAEYGFTFFELTNCSPKAEKTKQACKIAIQYILENSIVFNEMHATGLLTIKIIEKNTSVPRKILERHRKYIITVVEILHGEYRCLTPYVSSMKEG
ncbi:MAG: hypothetical protein WCI30_06555 [Clostridia bacterium]